MKINIKETAVSYFKFTASLKCSGDRELVISVLQKALDFAKNSKNSSGELNGKS